MSDASEGFGALIVVCALAVGGYCAYGYFTAPKVPTLEHQKMCADAATKYAKENGIGDFSNHFNEEFGRCFVETSSFYDGNVSRDVVDPLENTTYAHMDTTPLNGSPGKILGCYAKLPGAASKNCNTKEQWNDLIKSLMGSAMMEY